MVKLLKTAAISVRVPDEVKAAAEKAAQADSRSVAGLVEKVLVDYLRQHGYLKPKAKPRAMVL